MGNNESKGDDHFIEVSASGVVHPIFQAELNWGELNFSFGADFEEKLAQCLGVYQHFFLEGYEDFPGRKDKGITALHLPISMVDDDRMRQINREYRNKDKTTDVLSFPMYENLRLETEMIFEELEFGDIVISVPVMLKQAKEFDISVEGEFFHLLTHGFLHLCGYDHEVSEDEEKLMEVHEQRLIKKIYRLFTENKDL